MQASFVLPSLFVATEFSVDGKPGKSIIRRKEYFKNPGLAWEFCVHVIFLDLLVKISLTHQEQIFCLITPYSMFMWQVLTRCYLPLYMTAKFGYVVIIAVALHDSFFFFPGELAQSLIVYIRGRQVCISDGLMELSYWWYLVITQIGKHHCCNENWFHGNFKINKH